MIAVCLKLGVIGTESIGKKFVVVCGSTLKYFFLSGSVTYSALLVFVEKALCFLVDVDRIVRRRVKVGILCEGCSCRK